MSGGKYDIATPYTAVFVIFRKEGKVAFVLRANTDWMNNHYGLVAGKVEKDEFFIAAAIREAREEAGVELRSDQLKLVLVSQRMHNDSHWIDMIFEATSYDSEPYNAEPHVHSEMTWFAPSELPENMIPSVRKYILAVEAGQTFIEVDERTATNV